MARFILGITGRIGCGKSTVKRHIHNMYPCTHSLRFSDPLRETIAWAERMRVGGELIRVERPLRERMVAGALSGIFDPDVISLVSNHDAVKNFTHWLMRNWVLSFSRIEENRANLQGLSTVVRTMFGEDILERTLLHRSSLLLGDDTILVVEGIRRLVDVRALCELPNFRLFYLTCDEQTAYERVVARRENDGDERLTMEEFVKSLSAEAECEVEHLRPYAHAIICNNGTEQLLEHNIREEVKRWLRTS